MTYHWPRVFQSSPAPRRGRYMVVVVAPISVMVFQSSPAPRRGRYCAVECHPILSGCFNPRPRRGAGATRLPGYLNHQHVVSILARAEARALHYQRNNAFYL